AFPAAYPDSSRRHPGGMPPIGPGIFQGRRVSFRVRDAAWSLDRRYPMRQMIRSAGLLAGVCLVLTIVLVHAGDREVRQTNLVSDLPGQARRTDAHLVNPWGISQSPVSGPFCGAATPPPV